MSTLTVHVEGVLDAALEKMVKQGYAKTKAEAVGMALMRFAEEKGLIERKSIHQQAEEYAWDEIKKRLKRSVS